MSSSIKSIKEILNATKSISEVLIQSEKYFAHVPHDKSNFKSPETLNQHMVLVRDKFELLSDINKIDSVVDTLIFNLFIDCKLPFEIDIANFIKSSWVNTIVFHDYGKVNENFQANPKKMNNSHFKGKEVHDSPLSTHHSSLGAYLFIVHHFDILSKFKKECHGILSITSLYFSYSIFKHHGKYLGDNAKEKISFNTNEVDQMQKYISLYRWEMDKQFSNAIPLNTSKLFEMLNKYIDSFSLYNLTRLSFSMLTASDFLASGQYMTGIEVSDFGVLSRKRIEEIYEYISQSEWLNNTNDKINYNRSTFTKAKEEYTFQNPKDLSNTNLNILREEMGIEVLKTIRNHSEKNLFYIEAPTGGGKTNLAFLASIELLKLNENINKVFYVFPFTTLVTQTQKSLIETFGLSPDEVITLSSKSGFKEKTQQDRESNTEDDQYGSQKRFYLDNLFCLFPFCLLTHVKFFNILKTNEKEENYLLHRLANSIVVLDEMQAYSPDVWDKVIYFIKNYAHFYNIKFIAMSATLPRMGNLKIEGLNKNDFTDLISDSNKRYFQNPNFSKRVSFNLDLFDTKDLKLDDLAELLIDKSKKYALKDFGKPKPQGSIYTIIEFIFKKTATEFYTIIDSKNHFFDEVFVLSGTILEHRRKYIINYLKNPENRKKKVLLVTTQVVEAGVDIDMDIGFKDKSIIDSDEQLAGRINRNVNKEDCTLYLFNYNNEKIIYGKDKRYETTKSIPKEEYLEILQTKNFNKIYAKVLDGIDTWNNDKPGAIGFYEYEQNIKKLKFQSVHFDFKIIDKEHENLTVFIPLSIPISVIGTTNTTIEEIFSKNEIDFLSKNNIYPTVENKIEGSAVFDLYLDLIERSGDVSFKKIANRIMQGILSKFLIQLLGTNSMKLKLIEFQDTAKSDKGYIYLSRWNEKGNPLYSEIYGLNTLAFEAIETQFL